MRQPGREGWLAIPDGTATKPGFIMADMVIEYKGGAFYGDILHLRLGTLDPHKYGFDVGYEVQNQVGKLVALAETVMLCFDDTRQKRSLPAALAGQIGHTSS